MRVVESEGELFLAGASKREQRGGPPGVPGVLSSGERAVAQPDGEGTSGGVRRRERPEEGGRRCRHHTVRGGDTPVRYLSVPETLGSDSLPGNLRTRHSKC